MAQFTVFGKDIKKKLVDIDQNQEWLISQVRDKTGLFIDSSYLYKIMTGKNSTPKIVRAIREILELPDDSDEQLEGDT